MRAETRQNSGYLFTDPSISVPQYPWFNSGVPDELSELWLVGVLARNWSFKLTKILI